MNKIEKININGFDIRMYKNSNNKIMLRSSDLSYAITNKHGALVQTTKACVELAMVDLFYN